jgi:hypothetical protein
MHGEKHNSYRVLVGKPEEKIQLRKPGRRWEGNIKIDLREIEWSDMDYSFIRLRIGVRDGRL